MSVFESFVIKHDFLVCVDSDGCVMDTMNCKHFHCFGPCLVRKWELEQWRVPVLERWNQINLFQMTRGINRFGALATALTEIDNHYTSISGVETLQTWVGSANVLSDETLMTAIGETSKGEGRRCLEKSLNWSRTVDNSIAQLPDELKVPFFGAMEGLAQAHDFADVAI